MWPFECLILMILTMTKHHENLHRDSPLSLHKNNFGIMIILADMAIEMSDFDDFDNDQISRKLAQR